MESVGKEIEVEEKKVEPIVFKDQPEKEAPKYKRSASTNSINEEQEEDGDVNLVEEKDKGGEQMPSSQLLAVVAKELADQKIGASVHINKSNLRETEISFKHIDTMISKRQTLLDNHNEQIELDKHDDRLYVANRMRAVFRATREEGCLNSLMKLISVPLNILRDYTIPCGEEDGWDRNREAVVSMTIVFAFLWLNGSMQPEDGEDSEFKNMYFLIGLIALFPGAVLGLAIKMCTTVSRPPTSLMIISSLLSFVMSIMWISFTSNFIMDLLQIFGFITRLPEALLALTIIAWGNCLGDMSADVAMTKRGYGEMAITGCIAGPIFNVNIGLGLSMTLSILKSASPFKTRVIFSLYDIVNGNEVFNPVAILPLGLLIGQVLVLIIILINGIKNNFHISYRLSLINVAIYMSVIFGLIIYSLVKHIQPPSG